MEDLGRKVVEKIKEQKMCPVPRWRFLAKDGAVWGAFAVSVLIGSLAFSILLHIFAANGWHLYKYLHRGIIGYILITFPYIWFVFLVLFLALAYYNFRCTEKGYRPGTSLILGASVFASLFLGTVLFAWGLGGKIEDLVIANIPAYGQVVCCHHRKDVWSQPEKGLLSGKILQIKDVRNFTLEDFRGVSWHIKEAGDEASGGKLNIEPGIEVKMVGNKGKDHIFFFQEIWPWAEKGR